VGPDPVEIYILSTGAITNGNSYNPSADFDKDYIIYLHNDGATANVEDISITGMNFTGKGVKYYPYLQATPSPSPFTYEVELKFSQVSFKDCVSASGSGGAVLIQHYSIQPTTFTFTSCNFLSCLGIHIYIFFFHYKTKC
jgi:hypothetical protein